MIICCYTHKFVLLPDIRLCESNGNFRIYTLINGKVKNDSKLFPIKKISLCIIVLLPILKDYFKLFILIISKNDICF